MPTPRQNAIRDLYERSQRETAAKLAHLADGLRGLAGASRQAANAMEGLSSTVTGWDRFLRALMTPRRLEN